MSLNPAYGPQNETASDILLERTFMQAGYLTGVGFGIQLMLYVACMRLLAKRPSNKLRNFMFGYLTLLCILNGIWTATSTYGLQATFIDNRNFPGGPLGFLGVEFDLPFNDVSNAAYIATNILCDALLVWRCMVIWSISYKGFQLLLIMAFPIILLLASIAVGIAFAITTATPSGLYGAATFIFALPYFTISPGLNIILTFFIAGRIWAHKRFIARTLDKQYVQRYTSITAIFIESAAIYSVAGILLLATFASGNPINQIWLAINPAVQLIANYLIIYRVAEGSAWSTTVKTSSSTGVDFTNKISTRRVELSDVSGLERSENYGSNHNIPLNIMTKNSSNTAVWESNKGFRATDTVPSSRTQIDRHSGDDSYNDKM